MMDESSEILEADTAPAIVTDPQTGREFVSSYRYRVNFETEFDYATRRMLKEYGKPTERFALGLASILGTVIGFGMQGAIYGVQLFVSDKLLALAWIGVILSVLVVMFTVALWWGLRGRTRFRKRLVEQRLCFDCGYALIGQPLDEAGLGRCPECATSFDVRRYLRPPKRYHRVGPKTVRGGRR